MITDRERKTHEKAASDYANWSILAFAKFIMNVVVYADESGTHDPKARQPGSKIAAFGGYIGFADDWARFSADWQSSLNKYGLSYFHFSEYANKHECAKSSSQYFGWDDTKRRNCLFELAHIAGSHALTPVAGVFLTARFQSNAEIKLKLRKWGLSDEAINGVHLMYLGLLAEFFEAVIANLNAIRPGFMEDISFVFDQKKGDFYWDSACKTMYEHYSRDDHRFRNYGFSDKQKELPLQAADMFAYRARQIYDTQEKTQADHVLNKLDFELWGGREKLSAFMFKCIGIKYENRKEWHL